MLNIKNKHDRDDRLKMNEETHRYCIDGSDIKFKSVSVWVSEQFEPFNEDKVLNTMLNSPLFVEGHKYWGMTREEIKHLWKVKAREASEAGTKIHKQIEEFYLNENEFLYNKDLYDTHCYDYTEERGEDWLNFLNFVKENPMIQPYRVEWRLYDEELKIAGTLDMLGKNNDGTYTIYDWKRAQKICLPRVKDKVINTNFWIYTLQQSFYALLLERNYGLTVKDLYLVKIHPNEKYRLIKVPDMKNWIINKLGI